MTWRFSSTTRISCRPVAKFAGQLRLQRPDHAHLVQPDAELPAGVVVEPQVEQRLARVVVGLAAGDQAESVVRTLDHVVVQAVGADIGQRGIPLVMEQARFLVERMVGPADVQAARGHLEIRGNLDLHVLRVDHRRGAGLDDLLDRLHARPDAGEPAHGKRVNAQIEDFLDRRGEEHRRAAGLENVVALVRGGGAFGYMVVTGHGNHAAPGCRAGHVGVFEHVGAPVHARALAVPDAEHTVEPVGAGRGKSELLRAPQRGRSQLFIHAGLEHNVLRLQVGRCLP
jgi:hypothetical protein